MLAIERANKERIKHTHIHNTRPFSKTHILMLAMEFRSIDKEGNRLFLVKHTEHMQDHSVKLTP